MPQRFGKDRRRRHQARVQKNSKIWQSRITYTPEYCEFLVKLGMNILKYRLGKGWTQTDLANNMPRIMGRARKNFICEIERGIRPCSIRYLHDLAATLDVDMHDLIPIGFPKGQSYVIKAPYALAWNDKKKAKEEKE